MPGSTLAFGTDLGAPAAAELPAPERPSRTLWRRIAGTGIGLAGGVIVLACLLAALLAPALAPYPPDEVHAAWRLFAPNQYFLLGTDEFGRDILSRVLYGAQISLSVGVISVAIAFSLGVTLGLLAGFYGRWVDSLIMRCMDVLFAFPAILLAVAIMAMLGASTTNTMLAIGVVYTPSFARITRSSVLSLKEQEFVQAARVVGIRDSRIMLRHIVPNLLAPLIVQTTFSLSTAILTEAALSFLGLGTPPPAPSWGIMLSASRRYVELSPWPAIWPGLAIMLLVLGFNLLGDGLRDILDPRLQTE